MIGVSVFFVELVRDNIEFLPEWLNRRTLSASATGDLQMAKANLLNTGTSTFLELIGNGRLYTVPPYQRDYSWTEEQWEDLWTDIEDLSGRMDETHYMGALVVEGRSDREFAVIDGQQRLATLSLLVLAVVGRLHDLASQGIESANNLQRAEALRARFVGEKDPASLVESSKLTLNDNDNAFYQDYLVQLRLPLNPRGLSKSNTLLWKCFTYFKRQVEAWARGTADGAQLARLVSETAGRQLMFIRIAVDNELNAYTVFETLNARGLELSATDLLKNYLFSRLRTPADLQALQRRWKALMATVLQERFPEFLRYHLQCELPRVRTQRLFKLVRDRVRTGEDTFALLDALERRAEVFAALFCMLTMNGSSRTLRYLRPTVRGREANLFATSWPDWKAMPQGAHATRTLTQAPSNTSCQ